MKKIIVGAFALMFMASCNDDAGKSQSHDSELKQKNIAASNAISKAFETGDISAIDSVVSDDFIDHTDRGDMKGPDSLKAAIKWVHANMKDMKMQKMHELADDEYVYSWMRYTGTSDGTMGMPNGPYDMSAIEVAKFKDGKAIEHWNFMEIRDVMKMMPPPPQPLDTTKAKK